MIRIKAHDKCIFFSSAQFLKKIDVAWLACELMRKMSSDQKHLIDLNELSIASVQPSQG